MRSRRRKGRRNRDGLWTCGIAVLAAGAVFTARTEILDLVTTEIAFVLDPKQVAAWIWQKQMKRELILTRRIQMQERRLPAAEIRIRKP